jgi:lipopolysaccharide export system protein LptA
MGTLAVMLAFGFILAGCDSDTDSDSASPVEISAEKLENDLKGSEPTVTLTENVVMDRDLKIPTDKTLVIPVGITLTVSGGQALAASGGRTLTVAGTLTINGRVVGRPSAKIDMLSSGIVDGANAGAFLPGKTYTWPTDGTARWQQQQPSGGGGSSGGNTTAQAKEAAKDLAQNSVLDGKVNIIGTIVALNMNATTTNAPFDIPAGVTFEITANSKLETTGDLNVAAGATVAVDRGGTLEALNGSGGRLDGTITVAAGGELVDNNTNGGKLWDDGTATGQIVLSAGAKASVGSGPTLIVGGANDTGAKLKLTEGTLTMKAKSYELDGELTVAQAFNLDADDQVLTIKAGRKLTVSAGLWLGPSGNNLLPIIGEAGASIVISNGGSITGLNAANANNSNFYADDDPNTSVTVSNISGSCTYNWSTSNNRWELVTP